MLKMLKNVENVENINKLKKTVVKWPDQIKLYNYLDPINSNCSIIILTKYM
ncbi:hypothetical protein [Plasmodium yoelii yoelii]|uniref:Uncharacterized protein n=1 Tax=Plasmodium yoelii yoelii TaxID=73239 RepID=Q7RRA1_PLAYO|nr:hypothetical protein [Plasmodium yoelii yoelii]